MLGFLYAYLVIAFFLFVLDLGGFLFLLRSGHLDVDGDMDKGDWRHFALSTFHSSLAHALVWPLTIPLVYIPQVKEIRDSGRLPELRIGKMDLGCPQKEAYVRQYEAIDGLLCEAINGGVESGKLDEVHNLVAADCYVRQAWRCMRSELIEDQKRRPGKVRRIFMARVAELVDHEQHLADYHPGKIDAEFEDEPEPPRPNAPPS